MKVDQEKLNEFGTELSDLLEKYGNALPPYELVNRLICSAVAISLYCAPNSLLAFKTIVCSLENGMVEYEYDYKEEIEDES